MCFIIFLLSAAHFPWKLICGTSLWPLMKMLSFRENLLLLLPNCLRPLPVPDCCNLNLALKFFYLLKRYEFTLKKKKKNMHEGRFLWLRCVKASPTKTGSTWDQSYFFYRPSTGGGNRNDMFISGRPFP